MITAIRSTHSEYTRHWHIAVDKVAQAFRNAVGEDTALDLLNEQAKRDGWTPELVYMGLRILKPFAPIGQEAAA